MMRSLAILAAIMIAIGVFKAYGKWDTQDLTEAEAAASAAKAAADANKGTMLLDTNSQVGTPVDKSLF